MWRWLQAFVKGFPGISWTWPLNSGYSVTDEERQAVDVLRGVQADAMRIYPAKELGGGELQTFCNEGLWIIADELGCRDLDGKTAACIVTEVGKMCATMGSAWRMVSWEDAVVHAMKGGLAFMGIQAPPGEAHGHVASVAPKPMDRSPSWNIMVPYLANVGVPPNGVKLASACFRREELPMIKCFAWTKPDES